MVAVPPMPAMHARRRVATLLIDNYDSYTYNIYQMLAQVNGVAPIVMRNDDFGGDWHAAWRAFERQAKQQYAAAKHASCMHSIDTASSTDSSTDSADERSDFDSESDDDDSDVRNDDDGDALVLNIVISPGPGHPGVATDFGMCADAIRFATVPLLGVCLGHQGLAHVYGGDVVRAPEVMHGRTSQVFFATESSLSGDLKTPSLFAHIRDGFDVVRYHSLVVVEATLPPTLRVTARTADNVVMALQHVRKRQFGVQFHPEAVCSSAGYQLLQNFRDVTLSDAPSPCRLHHSNVPTHVVARPLIEQAPRAASTAAPTPMPYRVHVRVAARGCASLAFADTVFATMFAAAKRSFWLDSSNFDRVAAAAAPATASRFSLMGDNSGPLSYAVEYCVLEKLLRVYEHTGANNNDDECVRMEAQSDILSHLRAKMVTFQAHDVEFVDDACNRSSIELPFAFRGGYVGYFGYEVLGSGLQPKSQLDTVDGVDSNNAIERAVAQRLAASDHVPDASFVFADRTLVFDHLDDTIYSLSVSPRATSATMDGSTNDGVDAVTSVWHADIAKRLAQLQQAFPVATAPVPPPSATSTASVVFHPSRSKAQYGRDIRAIQRLIDAGETYEVCLTNQLEATLGIADPVAFYQLLRQRNPAPYAGLYFVNPHGRFDRHGRVGAHTTPPSTQSPPQSTGMAATYAICCSSPERFLRVDRDGWMESKPIKGTRPRGRTPSADAAIARELAACMKDRAENMMIADLVRNDFGRVAQIGSVHVPTLMAVETYATVHQLVTTVRGQRRVDADTVDILDATFPGGSMTGAPKTRTMEIIRQLEQAPRGVYSGALGFLSIDGSCDLNIVIRTAVVTPTHVRLGSGGAIIALSDTDDEYDEMLLKTRALVQAIGAFVTGRDDGARVDAGNDAVVAAAVLGAS